MYFVSLFLTDFAGLISRMMSSLPGPVRFGFLSEIAVL
jgi:hypothetical protein